MKRELLLILLCLAGVLGGCGCAEKKSSRKVIIETPEKKYEVEVEKTEKRD